MRSPRSRHDPVPHPRAPCFVGEAVAPDDPVGVPSGLAGLHGKGNRYHKGVLGEVATAAAKTDTFLKVSRGRTSGRWPPL